MHSMQSRYSWKQAIRGALHLNGGVKGGGAGGLNGGHDSSVGVIGTVKLMGSKCQCYTSMAASKAAVQAPWMGRATAV